MRFVPPESMKTIDRASGELEAFVYGRLEPNGPDPTGAAEFETWDQDDDNPMELIGGWVLPMSPGNFKASRTGSLLAVLLPFITARGRSLSIDARHRLPRPGATVVFPDIAVHSVAEPPCLPGTESVGRVPELVVEIPGKRTFERDMAPHGARFLAYQMSGVREYYYTWPDGTGAAGFVLADGVFAPLRQTPDGYFASPLLGVELRLVEAAVRG
ncbi:MAG: Uma2 family endonuclease [Planctomycetes bacterium]|nr:Uma2 family endonuclease [Planctomycetota bacterium]